MTAIQQEKKQPKQKPPKLSKKQRGFVKDYIETGNATLAAKKNYDVNSDNTARSIGSENLTKPAIVNAIQAALPDELLAKVHLEGLNATKLSGTGGMRLSMDTDGDLNEFGHSDLEVPDYAVRHKYLESAYKLKGLYSTEPPQVVNNTQNIFYDAKIQTATRDYEASLKKLLEDEPD